ncbi:MAG: hypothetical protein GWN14_12380, partial [candidate division Zixibacteria bacterium]|nr:hypothetical protein [candidate division Zixibacteria bacterium]
MQWILQHSTGGKNLFGIVMVLLLTLTIAFARDLTPVVTTMPSKGGLVLLTRAILHNPARHYLPLRMPLSQGKIMITLFTHSGVMIRQTVVQPEAYADRIALKEILGTQAARIAAGYYLYRIEPLKDKIHAPTRLLSDSLRFEEVSTTHLQYDSTYAGFTDFSDLTGEGHPDILLGVSTIFRQPRLFVNDGSGRFQDETGIRLPQFSLAVADLVTFDADRDGDRDIYLAAQDSLGMFYQRGRLLLNDGSGLFTDVTLTHLPDLPTTPINVDA